MGFLFLRKGSMFPIFLKLEGRQCLVVGAGTVAEGKIRGLLDAGAIVRVVAPNAVFQIRRWDFEGKLNWKPREFDPRDLDGISIVIAATNSHKVNTQIF